MAPDRTILNLVKKNISDPLPLSRIMACTLLSLSYAPGMLCWICSMKLYSIVWYAVSVFAL